MSVHSNQAAFYQTLGHYGLDFLFDSQAAPHSNSSDRVIRSLLHVGLDSYYNRSLPDPSGDPSYSSRNFGQYSPSSFIDPQKPLPINTKSSKSSKPSKNSNSSKPKSAPKK